MLAYGGAAVSLMVPLCAFQDDEVDRLECSSDLDGGSYVLKMLLLDLLLLLYYLRMTRLTGLSAAASQVAGWGWAGRT
jgi:hypothetical protein